MYPQCERLLAHLKEHRAINPMEAWTKLGIYRLGARVWDLRKAGYPVASTFQKVPNRFGETCRVASYRLGQDETETVPEGCLL